MVADVTPNFPPPWGPSCLDIAVPLDIFLNMATHTLFHEALRHVDGILHRFGCGAPVANNTGAVDPKERRATILRSVHPLADIVQGRPHQNRRQAAPWGVGQAGLEGLAIHLRQPFAHLEGNIANKAITHDHISGTAKNMLPFDIADEIEVALQSTFAPTSRKIVNPFWVGNNVAMAGRSMPLSGLRIMVVAASVAPVFP